MQVYDKNKIKKQSKILTFWLKRQFNYKLLDIANNMSGGGLHKWNTLEHNGVLFPLLYKPHGIPLKYKEGDNFIEVKLDKIAEEYAMLYAKYINSEYSENKTFNKNFWNDWKRVLGKNSPIRSLEYCDFSKYKEILEENKLKKKDGIEEKSDNSDNIDKDATYKTAMVDGKPQPVGNFRMEPPGIFLGRGDNPKLGKIKRYIYPEDITINIGKDAKKPELPDFLSSHKWGKIIHDRKVEWLASWRDDITGKTKYLWLGAQSDFKANSDREKFDLARKLKRKIDTIRKENEKKLYSMDVKERQVATAFYFIDNYALRVGNEKGSDETDTVGVTSLRVEHVEMLGDNTIALDFLGKDSVRYYNKLKVDSKIYENILNFIEGKEKYDEVFNFITSSDINKYLQTFMKELTAKVFRTYNASYLFQKELNKINKKYENSKDILLLLDEFNKANAKVAQLCNHQKNVGKSFKTNIDKIDEQIKKIRSKLRKTREGGKSKEEKVKELEYKLTKLKLKKELKVELKNISLGTSKSNYIDPRITVAFLKLHSLPVEKVFSTALRDKFKWAFEVESDYKF
jgi:DNA topoisomerase-1